MAQVTMDMVGRGAEVTVELPEQATVAELAALLHRTDQEHATEEIPAADYEDWLSGVQYEMEALGLPAEPEAAVPPEKIEALLVEVCQA